ncbi:UPAR/Ly6 domain-containing protein bou-like [Tubulanus polymorphus]|uniref:UPAR/Ly6 domain-containing protein bou-like n=1 Tax=Tubulanus polymorphus TaxID=672921 RepID=UPI003DA1DA7E
MLPKNLHLGLSVWIFLIALSYLPYLSNAFECYQCNSTHSDECLEMFDPEMTNLVPTACNVVDTKYCIKITGAWGGVVGTQRFCSSRDMGNQCQYFGFDDHDRIYRGCSWTCDSERCNSSNRLSLSIFIFSLPLVLFLRKILFRS